MESTQPQDPAETHWAFEPLTDGVRQIRQIMLTARLSARAIDLLQERPDHIRLLAQAEHATTVFLHHDPEALEVNRIFELNRALKRLRASGGIWAEVDLDLNERLEIAREDAESAKEESSKGFSSLYNQAFVTAWGTLEDTIRTFLAVWLENTPEARRKDKVAKLRIRLGEYDPLDEKGKMLYIVELLFQEYGRKMGLSRYENLLDIFGLSGSYSERIKEVFFEGYHLRNVLVHRRGIVDLESSRHLPSGYTVGEPVRFTEVGLQAHLIHGMLEYLSLISQRVAEQLEIKAPQLNLGYVLTKDWSVGYMQ
jgi:hypothetical protein